MNGDQAWNDHRYPLLNNRLKLDVGFWVNDHLANSPGGSYEQAPPDPTMALYFPQRIARTMLTCIDMDNHIGMFSTGIGHLDLNIEGYSRWYEADTTHTNNEELKLTDTYNNFEWRYHVPFVDDNVSSPPWLTRDGCRAAFKINFDKEKMLWVVTEFVTMHSHKLSPSNHSQFLRSQRNVKDCNVAQVQSLKSVRVKTSQVMDHQLYQSGCIDEIDAIMYTFKKFGGGDTTWTMRFTPFTNSFNCSCKMFDTLGIPYCHAFSVMKAMNQHNIPESLIMQRWAKTAKDVSEVESSPTVTTPTIMQLARYEALISKCIKLSYYTSMSNDGYKQVNMAIEKLTIQMKGLLPSSGTTTDENVHHSQEESPVRVRDLVIAVTKGSVRQNKIISGKASKCGKFGQPGHTTKTCHSYV
ncbi:hypothetical protein Ddye_015960 [Dipteronia dyeriana]|uniref:Protein FAR1-RELATED SEQUENCE n=1 Tax=Dipteronia dyeriana TaxID=168575 RepID=A0AAD9U6K0_9ROSI|nr:hypothetical protein Ddye_015960 [Dipteronia dyeriana]